MNKGDSTEGAISTQSGASEKGILSTGSSSPELGGSGVDTLLSLEQKTGKTIYELFAACYLPHHLVNDMPDGSKVPCRNAPMHGIMCRQFRDSKRVLIVAPAKFAKSTWSAFIQPLVDAVLGLVEGPILVISNTGRLAERWLSLIKEEIEYNKDIRSVFGDLKGSMWRNDQIKLKTGAEIVSLGLNYQIRGTGWGKAILDDMEDDEMVRSEDQREKFTDWFDGAFMGRMHPHTAVIVDGTFLHPLCKIKKMYDNPDGKYDGWVRLKFQALDENGESIWPERWPTEVIIRQRQEMGERMFLAEKMNEPLFAGNAIVRPEWIQYYDTLPGDLIKESWLDASSGKSKEVGDYCGHLVWGKKMGETKDQDKYFLLACDRGRWATYDKARVILRQNRTWHPIENWVEDDAWGHELKNVVENERQKDPVYCPIRAVVPDKNKERRLMAVTDLFQKNQVFFPRRGAERVIDELLMFPTGDYDDYADCTSGCLAKLRRERPRTRHKQQNWAVAKHKKPNAAGRLV